MFHSTVLLERLASVAICDIDDKCQEVKHFSMAKMRELYGETKAAEEDEPRR